MPLQEPNKKIEERKADLIKGSDALRKAAISGDYEKAKELCAKFISIDSDKEGRTALHYASAIGHFQIVKLLVESGADINAQDHSGYTCLHHSCTEGHVEVVRFLLKNGASIDHQDFFHGNTGLHEAAWKGYSQTIQVLCKYKANFYLKNKSGNTALHLTCQQGHNQSCRNILINGCKPDVKNNYGDTPLHTAARYGHAGVVRILISAFCDVNDVNKNGDTALHISAAMGRRKLTKLLLETGCDASIKNKQGETCMDITLRKSFKEVQEIITALPTLKIKEPKKVKREKESRNSSLASRTSKKGHKYKKGKSVSFPHNSPYGCPMAPNAEEFPKPNIDSLPSEPLKKGEQYFIDLAGNIQKGPVGKIFNCYCAPLINKVEQKMEMDKKEIKEHINTCHENLNEKIDSLEKKTNHQITSLNETVKTQFNIERVECIERTQKCNLKQRLDFERRSKQQAEQFKSQMKSWIDSNLPENKFESSNYYCENEQLRRPNHYSNVESNGTKQLDKNNCNNYDVLKNSRSFNLTKMCPVQCSINPINYNSVILNSKAQEVENNHNRDQNNVPSKKLNTCTNDIKSETEYKAEQEICCLNDCESNSEKSEQMKEEIFERTECKEESRLEPIHENFSNQKEDVEKKIKTYSFQDNEPVTDLMKSLRCNNVNIPEIDYRNSPFSDSGYRTKYSPSPRENTLQDHSNYPPNHYVKNYFHQPVCDPPIGLPITVNQMNGIPYFRKSIPNLRISNCAPTSSLV